MFYIGMDILVHSLHETLILVPYLYLTYLLIEYVEHHFARLSVLYVRKSGEYGPIAGGILGLIPQCGFSVAGANLYATGLITLGTMMAVFLSTSDEMIPVLISRGGNIDIIIKILALKLFYAIILGLAIDKYIPTNFITKKYNADIEEFCKRERCKCDKHDNIWKSAFFHTERISLFIFFFALLINAVFMLGNEETIKTSLVNIPFFSKFIIAGIGLIPSCYPSVLFTQLYMDGAISIGSLIAGTLSNAGLGFLVLYRVNTNKKETLKILGLLYIIGVLFGIITDIFM